MDEALRNLGKMLAIIPGFRKLHPGYKTFKIFYMVNMDNDLTYQWATVVLLFVVLCFILFTYQDFGITWDEYVQHQYGQYIVDYYATLGQDKSALNYKNLYLYGGFFDSIAVLLTKVLPGDTYNIRHLFNAIVGFIGLIGTLKLANLLGGSRVAFLAVLLLALEPFYLGNMFNNPKDIPFATAYVWSLYYMLSAFRYFPFIPTKLKIKMGIAIGLALSVHIGGILLYSYLVLAVVFYTLRPSAIVAENPNKIILSNQGITLFDVSVSM